MGSDGGRFCFRLLGLGQAWGCRKTGNTALGSILVTVLIVTGFPPCNNAASLYKTVRRKNRVHASWRLTVQEFRVASLQVGHRFRV